MLVLTLYVTDILNTSLRERVFACFQHKGMQKCSNIWWFYVCNTTNISSKRAYVCHILDKKKHSLLFKHILLLCSKYDKHMLKKNICLSYFWTTNDKHMLKKNICLSYFGQQASIVNCSKICCFMFKIRPTYAQNEHMFVVVLNMKETCFEQKRDYLRYCT